MAEVYATCSACEMTLRYAPKPLRVCCHCGAEGTLSLDETQSTPDGHHVNVTEAVLRRVSVSDGFYGFQAIVEQSVEFREPRLRLSMSKDRREWTREQWELIHHLGEEAWRLWRAKFG